MLARQQEGIVARRQLRSVGVDADRVRRQVEARRWRLHTPRVVGLTTGAPTPRQQRWIGVLHAGSGAVLGGLTAAELGGLAGWHRDEVEVWVAGRVPQQEVDGVRFVRGRRDLAPMRRPGAAPPFARIEPAVLLWAAYAADARAATGVLAAVVQQRLTTPTRLLVWLDTLHPVRRARTFRSILADVAGGSHSAAELDVLRMCRRHGMPLPNRQLDRHDNRGLRRWTDCEWDLPDGSVVLLEIDGAFHIEVRAASADKRRARRLAGPGRIQVACTADELRREAHEVARDLIALGVPGRASPDAA